MITLSVVCRSSCISHPKTAELMAKQVLTFERNLSLNMTLLHRTPPASTPATLTFRSWASRLAMFSRVATVSLDALCGVPLT